MAKITNATIGVSADAQKGDSLREVAQNNGLGIAFGCENGVCSTCLIQIKSGMENLTGKTDQEEFTLDARGAADDERLACQCMLKQDGDVEFEQ